jgi:hypothetical protein
MEIFALGPFSSVDSRTYTADKVASNAPPSVPTAWQGRDFSLLWYPTFGHAGKLLPYPVSGYAREVDRSPGMGVGRLLEGYGLFVCD